MAIVAAATFINGLRLEKCESNTFEQYLKFAPACDSVRGLLDGGKAGQLVQSPGTAAPV